MLETKTLILRNYKLQDIDDYFEYVSHADVGPRCGWEPYNDRQKAEQRLLLESRKPLQFAIVYKPENKVVGSIEIIDIVEDYFEVDKQSTKEIGMLLSPKYWGKGIMTEAMQTIVKYCFEYLGLEKIVAGFYSPNISSQKVQQKCGFVEYKTMKNTRRWYQTNKMFDTILTQITKQQYMQNNIYKNVEITFIKPTLNDDLFFREITVDDKQQIQEYINEFICEGSVINGLHGANSCDSFEEMFAKNQAKRNLPDCDYNAEREQVPLKNLLLVRKSDQKIVGAFNYRKCITKSLDESFAGNIGYGIRPSERKKGYASTGLGMLLKVCRNDGLKFVRIGCYDKNIGSQKTILKYGAKLIAKTSGIRANNYYQIDL